MIKTWAITTTTFRESVRSKVFYLLFLFAFGMIGFAALLGSVTIGDQVIVIENFGLFSILLFSVAYAIIGGSTFLSKELERKTIYNILSKEVARYEFIAGKFLGLLMATTLLLVGMGSGLIAFVFFWTGAFHLELFYALYCIFLQLAIVCATITFFSSIVVTPVLSGLFSFGVFLTGRSTQYLLACIDEKLIQGFGAKIIQGVYWGVPHLDKIDVSNLIVYGESIPATHFLSATFYTLTNSILLVIIASWIFRYRDFQ